MKTFNVRAFEVNEIVLSVKADSREQALNKIALRGKNAGRVVEENNRGFQFQNDWDVIEEKKAMRRIINENHNVDYYNSNERTLNSEYIGDTFQVCLERGSNGAVLCRVDNIICFPDTESKARYDFNDGEMWEVEITGVNKEGTTLFFAPVELLSK